MNEESIVSYTSDELRTKGARCESKTDWAKVDAMNDEELEAIIASDPDDEEAIGLDWMDVNLTKLKSEPHEDRALCSV